MSVTPNKSTKTLSFYFGQWEAFILAAWWITQITLKRKGFPLSSYLNKLFSELREGRGQRSEKMVCYLSTSQILWISYRLCLYWLFLECTWRNRNFLQHVETLKRKNRFTIAGKIFFQRLRFGIEKLWKSPSTVARKVVILVCLSLVIYYTEDYIGSNTTVSHLIYLFAASSLCYGCKDDREMAVGLAWSFYFGYLQIMLPKLVDAPKYWHDENGVRQEIEGWFILIPSDCRTPGDIKDKDDRIHQKDNFRPIKADTAGIKNRVFKNTVYEVEIDKKQRHSFYCFLEYATPVRHFYNISQSKYAEHTSFGSAEMSYQNDLFESTIRDILDRYEDDILKDSDRKLKDFVQLVRVDGDGTNIADAVVMSRWNMKGHSEEKKMEGTYPVTIKATQENPPEEGPSEHEAPLESQDSGKSF